MHKLHVRYMLNMTYGTLVHGLYMLLVPHVSGTCQCKRDTYLTQAGVLYFGHVLRELRGP